MSAIKLLDFGVEFSGDSQMARPRTIAWPVKAYRVTLPEAAAGLDTDLNPFELLLLRLLEIDGPVSESRLAEETCIPEDFVKGVLLRLQDKDYIDDRNNIRKGASDAASLPVYKPAMVFQELVEGRVLPYVYYNTKPAQKNDETGLYCWQMARGDLQTFETVSADDVRNAIKEQRRHDRAYGSRSELPAASTIRVSGGNEFYNLECPIGMRASDGEFRIGNPFGKGYSLVLEDIFMQRIGEDPNLENWINAWRESLTRKHENEDARGSEPYDTARNRKRYPKLVASLRPNKNGIRTVERIYSSIEWALFYSNEKQSVRGPINLLRLTKASDTPAIIKAAAEEIGFETPERGYLRVQEQSLESYQEEVPEMPTALALAILAAKSDDAHPLRRFAREHPDGTVQLYQIKKERDIRSHGKGRGSQDGPNGKNELFMKDFIHALLPDIVFGEGEANGAEKSNAYLDARFEARSSLVIRFGYKDFNTKFNPLTQDRLVDAECFWISFTEGENALSFVGDLYAALQCELSLRVEPSSIRASTDSELDSAMKRRAKELGLDPLPESLSTVRPNNIRKAMQGLDETTLGALVVAYMLTADEEQIERLLHIDATFFPDVGEIIAARGHLNEARPFTKKEVDKYRELAYRAIGALVES